MNLSIVILTPENKRLSSKIIFGLLRTGPQRPHSVRPSRHVPFGHHSRLVCSTAGIGPWTDTFPAVHGEPTAAD